MLVTKTARNFTASATVRLNAAWTLLGTALAALPDILTELLAILGTPEVQRALESLAQRSPEAVQIIQLITRIAGALLVVVGALGMRQRVKSNGAVLPPKVTPARSQRAPE